jgi:hypothetical protein
VPQSVRRRTLWRGTRRRWEKLARADAQVDLAARLPSFSESQFLSALALVSATAAVHDSVAVLLAVSAKDGQPVLRGSCSCAVLDNEGPTSAMAVLSGHQSTTTTPGQDGEAQGSRLLEAVL